MTDTPDLVSATWLAAHLEAPDLVLIDAAYNLSGNLPLAREIYDAGHLPGARFFDIGRIVDLISGLPNTVPDADTMTRHPRGLGISDTSYVVI